MQAEYAIMSACHKSWIAVIRWFFWALAACFYCQACFAEQTYPFSVENEKEGDGHRIVARNNGPSPVSVVVSLTNSAYISSDRPFPIVAVVPPNGGILYLAHIRAAMSGVGYTFSTKQTWILGDYNAGHSPDALYRLPYPDGATFRIGQSPGGPITTHNTPESRFAVDIPMPEGTPVLAARDGVVIHAEANQVYGAQIPDMMSKANEVKIQHVDGSIAVYAHLAHGGVYAYPGQRVRAGDQIGLAGSTGYSSGPHLHFAVEVVRKTADGFSMESLPFRFYVGRPPMAFSPQFGMLALAEYSMPGTIPGMGQATQTARAQPSAQQPPTQGSGISVTVDPVALEFISRVKRHADDVGGYAWFAIVGGVVLILFQRNNKFQERRRREHDAIREPIIRD